MLISILKCALVGPAEKVTHMLAPFYLYCQHFSLSAVQILLTRPEECSKKQVRGYFAAVRPHQLLSALKVSSTPTSPGFFSYLHGTPVTVPVSVFTLAARKPRARTED